MQQVIGMEKFQYSFGDARAECFAYFLKLIFFKVSFGLPMLPEASRPAGK